MKTLTELEKLADFYVIDLYDIMDDDFENVVIPKSSMHGLKHDEVTPQDFESISQFGKIIKNYIRIQNLIAKNK